MRDRPWVVGKTVEVRPVLRLCATFDHRVIDGAHAGKLVREIGRLLDDPSLLAAADPNKSTMKAVAPPAPA